VTVVRGSQSTLSFSPQNVDVRTYGAVGDGTTDDHDAINNAAAALAPNGGTLFLFGQHHVASNLTFAANVVLDFQPGATLLPDSGTVITLPPGIDATRKQHIFDYSNGGSVQWALINALIVPWAGPTHVSVCWWGADPTYTSDSAPAFNNCIAALNPQPFSNASVGVGCKIEVPTGKYKLLSSVHIFRCVWMIGDCGAYRPATVFAPVAGIQGVIFHEGITYSTIVGGPASTNADSANAVLENIAILPASKTVYTVYSANDSTIVNGSVRVPNFGSKWVANQAGRTVNTYVLPKNNYSGYYYKITSVSGTATTGATEPSWGTTIGGTTTDNAGANQVVYTNIGLHVPGFKMTAQNSGTTSAAGSQPLWALGATDGINQTAVNDNGITWLMGEIGCCVRMFRNGQVIRCQANNSEGDGIRIYADHGAVIGTTANKWLVDETDTNSNSGSGLFVSGSDANGGSRKGGNQTANGLFGELDKSFLGNSYWGGVNATNGYGSYAATDPNNSSQFFGVYTEGDQPPATLLGNSRQYPANDSAGTTSYGVGQVYAKGALNPFKILTNRQGIGGSSAYIVNYGEQNVPTILSFQAAADATPIRFQYFDAVGAVKWQQWTYSGANSQGVAGIAFNSYAHREGQSTFSAPRGIFIGPDNTGVGGGSRDSGPRIFSGTAPPNAAGGGGSINYFRVGDYEINDTPLVNGIAGWICVLRNAFSTSDWVAAHGYGGAALLNPASAPTKIFRAITSGTSDPSTEPNFASISVIGNTIAEATGTLVWEFYCTGAGVNPTANPPWQPVSAQSGRHRHDITAADVTAGSYTLGSVLTQDQFAHVIEITDSGALLTGAINVIVPTFDGYDWIFSNATTKSLTFKTAAGGGVTLAAGAKGRGYCDNTNVVSA